MNKKIIFMKSVKKYLSALMLFFVLLMLNNCGGGGGGGGSSSSVLDMMSANDVKVTSLNDQTGLILSDVFVSIAEVGKEQIVLKSANTGDSGVFTFSKIKIGSYIIKATKSGYESTTMNVVVTNGPQDISVRLKPSYPPDSISGIVKRSDTLEGVADVAVEIKDSSPIIKTISDANGNYVLSNVQPTGTGSAPYVIKASKAGFQPAERANVIKLPNIALKEVDITLQSSGSAEIMLPGKIIGVVKAGPGAKNAGEPVENIAVTLQDSGLPSDYSRSTGYFHIENVDAGKTFILTAIETTSVKKYKAYSQTIQLSSEQTLVQDIFMEPVDEVPPTEYGWLIGTVLDSVSKSALAGVSVELLGTSLYDITKANGSFKVINITPETEYLILCSKTGYVSYTDKINIKKDQNNMDAIELVPSSSSQNYCSIIGVVRDKDTQVAVPGINVEISVPDTNSITFTKISTTTGTGGAFVFEKIFIPNDKVDGQNMTMILSRNDYKSLTIQITAKGGKVNQLSEDQTAITKMKGKIFGNIVDANTNKAIPGANVTLNNFSYPNITNPIASAAGNGYFEFQGLPVRAEAYKLMVSAEGYATEAIAGMTITYDTQALGPLTIQLAKDYGTVTGFVYLEVNGVPGYQSGSGGDTPISGISVTANETITSSGELGTELAFDRSKLDGSYKLDSLPTSNLYVVANSSNPIAGYSSFFQSYKVEKGINSGINIELTKTKGEITGTIFEDINKNGTFDNEPYIGGATVFVQQNGTTIASSISEANGAFKLTGLNADTFNIEVKMTGYKDTAKTITLTENSSVSNVFIAMYKPVGRLVGRVIDFDTPVPKKGIAGIKVSVLGESLLTAITDSNGTYVINNVPAASLQITSWNLIANGTELGYGSATTSVNAPQEGATQNVSDIELYSKTRQVWGKIVNSIDSVGIQGIKVKISGTSYEAVTDASGAYYFGSIPVNSQTNYNLIINDTIIENGIYRYRSRDDVSIVVADESATLKIQDITVIPNTGKIRGMVYDSLTGFPIKSSLFSDPIQAELTLPGITTPVTASVSQVNGEFVIDKIPSGSHNVKIKHAVTGSNLKMFEETSRISSVNAGQTTDLGIIYVTIKTITLRGYICDRVVNDKIGSNYYISGAMIQASINGIPYTKTSTTSYDGTYQMTVPAYSDYTIKVSSPNYMDSEETSLSLQLPGPFIKNFYINPRVGNISGTVYLDSNANYYYDMGDTVKIKVAHSKYMSGTFTVKTNYRGVPYSVMVDANSTFSFTNLPVGNYYITIDPPAAALDPAYAELNSTSWLEGPSGNRIVNVNNSSTTVINTVVVKTAYPTGSISGNIVDTTSLEPLAGTKIQVSAGLNNQNITTTTDSSGYFTISPLVYYTDETDTNAAFTLNITRDSYVTVQKNYIMQNTPKASREILIYEKLTKVTGKISGYVKDNKDKMPIANVKVAIIGTDLSAETGSDGAYMINDVPAGTYKLYFLKLTGSGGPPDTNYSTATVSGVQVISMTTKIIDDVFLSTSFSSINGVMYLETNGISGYQSGADKPLSDITVTATVIGGTLNYTYTTASDGKYSLTNMQLGNYELRFTVPAAVAEGYYAQPVTVNLPDTTAVPKDVQMQAKQGDIYGVIFFDENKNGIKDGAEQGITGINISIPNTFGSVFTPASPFTTGVGGEYEFRNLNPVTGIISVTNNTNLKTYQKKDFSQTIVSGQRTKVDIAMYRNTVTIRGKVIDIDTTLPISDVNVSINGTSYSTKTDTDGKFTLANVAIGSGTVSFKMTFEAISLGYKTQDDVTSPSTSGDDITMSVLSMEKSTRDVRGRVVNADLKPLNNVTVKIIGETDVTAVTTDIDGYFTLTTVSVDLVNQKQLELTATDYEITFKNFMLETGTTTYMISPDIQMTSSLAEISGTVLDELTGGPVSSPNFAVSINLTNDTLLYTTAVGVDGKFKIKNIKKGGPFDLAVQSSTGSNQYFNDVMRTVTLSAGQKLDIGTIYIKLSTVAVKGTIYDSKVYNLAVSANNTTRAGVANATVTAKYKRNDGTYYQVTSSPTLSAGSFEVQLPSLRFEFEVSCLNYVSQSFPGININSYPNSYNGLDFKIDPLTVRSVYGRAFLDSNVNGYVDSADSLIFTANGGAFQSLQNTLIVSYDYHSFTFDAFVQSDSAFMLLDVPVAPDGTKRFTIYDRNLGNNIAPSSWRDSTGNNVVTLNSGGTNPSSIDIAVTIGETQYGTILGQVRDDKIWTEGALLYSSPSTIGQNSTTGYNRDNTNYFISGASLHVTSASGFNQTFTVNPDGRFNFKVPGGNTYTINTTASGYSDTTETNIVVTSGLTTAVNPMLYPKIGTVTGNIYYDNNLNTVNSEPTDYNHLHEASEPTINSVTSHPTVSSNWSGATFNVMYSYRGLTFGTTSYSRTNSEYIIQKVPAGTYNNFVVQDVTSLSNWINVGNDYSQRQFMSQIYTLDGKTSASVTVAENATTTNVNFAVMVWGGHITGIKLLTNGTDYSEGEFYLQAPATLKAKMRGEDYWIALGGPLDKTDGLNIPRRYYLELFDLRDGGGSSGIKPLKFADAQGVIKMMSYPVGSDPDIIIPPGTYVLSIAGDVDLSGSPLPPSAMGPNTDTWMAWYTSATGFFYKYGLSGSEATAKDRCQQNIIYYQGAATGGTGIDLRAGQTHLILNN